jgi:hypothetical protein
MSSELVPYKDLEAMAQDVVHGGLFPGLKTVSQALTLFLVAQAEGLHPMTAAMRYNIIQGRPALKAEAMLASFMERGGQVKWLEWNNEACEAEFKSPGCPDGVKVRWTMDDAKRAGVTGNPVWTKYPRQMLKARVASDGVRMADPAVNQGRYTPEEVQDFEPETKVKADAEVLPTETALDGMVAGAEAEALSGEDSNEAEAPPAIESASNPMPTQEWLRKAAENREAALEKYAKVQKDDWAKAVADAIPEHLPIEQKLAAVTAAANAKAGRPKSVPEFCEACNQPVLRFEASNGAGPYWECHARNQDRKNLKAQGVSETDIRKMVADHYFKWTGAK